VIGKQTYEQLAKKDNVSKRTIQRTLDKYVGKKHKSNHRKVIILMDTTYFGRGFGVTVFRDSYNHENLYWEYVKHETAAIYKTGINLLQEQGYEILGIVCDGKRGLLTGFPEIPVQMCQFHQIAIVTRYITKKPKLQAGKELKEVVEKLVYTDKASFAEWLQRWYEKWDEFINEKTVHEETGQWCYTHKRVRSAYMSLKRNLPYLFMWEKYYELKIPNTTNSLEGIFSNVKNKLRVHAGLRQRRKQKVIDTILDIK